MTLKRIQGDPSSKDVLDITQEIDCETSRMSMAASQGTGASCLTQGLKKSSKLVQAVGIKVKLFKKGFEINIKYIWDGQLL